jgi:hypothetical protein
MDKWHSNQQASVVYLINTLPGSSSVNTVHYATIEEAVFYVVHAKQQMAIT